MDDTKKMELAKKLFMIAIGGFILIKIWAYIYTAYFYSE